MFKSAAPAQPANAQSGGTGAMGFGNSGAAPSGSPSNNGASMPSNMQNGQPNGGGQNLDGQQKAPDPMDRFSKMWDTPTNSEVAPTFSLDDKVVGEVAGAQDFMKGINPELMQKATSGDVSALMQMMQEVSRNAYKASLQHSGKLSESFVSAREKFNDKSFSSKVGKELTVSALSDTPNFQNPVVRKQLVMVAESLQRQHPDASPSEIADMSREYLTELSSAINPQASNSDKTKNKGPVDFNDWFDQNPE